jgi:hypothetical protein
MPNPESPSNSSCPARDDTLLDEIEWHACVHALCGHVKQARETGPVMLVVIYGPLGVQARAERIQQRDAMLVNVENWIPTLERVCEFCGRMARGRADFPGGESVVCERCAGFAEMKPL